MNKAKFRIKNRVLATKFAARYPRKGIRYPDTITFLDQKYGPPEYVDPMNTLSNWTILDKGNWGSARPDNLCAYAKENVTLKGNSMVITTTAEQTTGKDWNGKDVTKPFRSGYVTSNRTIRPGQVVSATLNTSESYAGSWFAFWLIKKHVEGDNRYREIDIFEKFMEKKNQKRYSISIHGGSQSAREMMNFHYPRHLKDETSLTFTCELHSNSVVILVDGIQLFLAEEPDFDGEYHVIFDDAPTTHGGRVNEATIRQVLPRRLEILDFRIYSL
jgi:hypothetical protein